ncbi:class I SAM-dependent DNA methyltransferase [Sorangium sp. So ce295]
MPTPRQVLDLLSRNELLALADAHRLSIGDRRVKAHIADRIEMTGPPMPDLLVGLSRDRLAELCRQFGLDGGGRAKAPLITRLAGSSQQALPWAPSSPGAAVSSSPRPLPRGTLSNMDQATHNRIISFIWGIADDVLRDLFVRGKYRDVILPMCVLRRLDAVLEPTRKQVWETKALLDKARITEQSAALTAASGQAFYNTSRFSLRDLKGRGNPQQLKADFEDYLDGFSQNVQEILVNFEFRNVLARLSKNDALGTLIEKFFDPDTNLSPLPVLNADGTVRLPAMDNHSMGTVFEELIRKFNEENNEEAGEHWTPRDAVRLMTTLMFRPIAGRVKSGSYKLYDCACGTGGMLTVAEETLQRIAAEHRQSVKTHLYGQEINPETYAICKADLLMKGEGDQAEHIIGGAEHSTLSHDAFPAEVFDFMLANPPYGKSWKKDLDLMGGKDGMRDPRFRVMHKGEELSLVTRSSDGQLLFLANMASKMNHKSVLGSRIAEVHNGSSLFTGDAGQGESNIRRWLFENDWVEAIVALPLNMFYNTGIATYVWVLSNRKEPRRKGKVQLIDASGWFKPLRKNLGKKNCELSEEDIARALAAYEAFTESEQSRVFDNEAFGYWKVTVERPLRLHSQLTTKAIEGLRFASGDEDIRSVLYDELGDALFENFGKAKAALEKRLAAWGDGESEDEGEEDAPKKGLPEKKKKKLLDPKTWERDGRLVETATALRKTLGGGVFEDHNEFRRQVIAALDKLDRRVGASDLKLLLRAVSWRVETAPPVIAKVHKPGKAAADPLRGLYQETVEGNKCVVEYEPDTDLRDTEQVPLLEKGGIEAFLRREVLPYAPDAWLDESKTQIGYEVSFTRHFYKPQRLRSLEEIALDIVAVEKEAEGLLNGLVKRGAA